MIKWIIPNIAKKTYHILYEWGYQSYKTLIRKNKDVYHRLKYLNLYVFFFWLAFGWVCLLKWSWFIYCGTTFWTECPVHAKHFIAPGFAAILYRYSHLLVEETEAETVELVGPKVTQLISSGERIRIWIFCALCKNWNFPVLLLTCPHQTKPNILPGHHILVALKSPFLESFPHG